METGERKRGGGQGYRATGERPAEGKRVARAPGNGPSARKWRAASTSRYALCSAASLRGPTFSKTPRPFRILARFSQALKPASRASQSRNECTALYNERELV